MATCSNVNCRTTWRLASQGADSWSMGGKQDGNPAVKRLAPLVQGHDGKEYGLRSTMVGDRMIRDGEVWIVDRTGFYKAIG